MTELICATYTTRFYRKPDSAKIDYSNLLIHLCKTYARRFLSPQTIKSILPQPQPRYTCHGQKAVLVPLLWGHLGTWVPKVTGSSSVDGAHSLRSATSRSYTYSTALTLPSVTVLLLLVFAESRYLATSKRPAVNSAFSSHSPKPLPTDRRLRRERWLRWFLWPTSSGKSGCSSSGSYLDGSAGILPRETRSDSVQLGHSWLALCQHRNDYDYDCHFNYMYTSTLFSSWVNGRIHWTERQSAYPNFVMVRRPEPCTLFKLHHLRLQQKAQVHL